MATQLVAYMDESFSEDEFVLAGYIATSENWTSFSEKWRKLLPGGNTFHMNDVSSSNPIVRDFYNVIEEHPLVPVACRLNTDDFNRARQRLFDQSDHVGWRLKDLGEHLENRYRFIFYTFMNNFHARRAEIKLGSEGPVDFIFDKRREQKKILASWNEYLENRAHHAPMNYGIAPRFEDDQEHPGLQAADFWAWWVRRWYEEDNSEIPDKMRHLDFGNWKGKSENVVVFPVSEDVIYETLREFAVRALVKHRSNWADD